ncbi:hypothetical protein EDB85DRAFT_2201858 [Lactarius pseudohatsudake]|nr:hypothetical protein EDB85DRAFT_2201858 [Lactarius pseudohatsudake]
MRQTQANGCVSAKGCLYSSGIANSCQPPTINCQLVNNDDWVSLRASESVAVSFRGTNVSIRVNGLVNDAVRRSDSETRDLRRPGPFMAHVWCYLLEKLVGWIGNLLQHPAEVRRPETRDLGSPGSSNVESEEVSSLVKRTGSNDSGESIRATARIRDLCDVVETPEAPFVQPGVEDAESQLGGQGQLKKIGSRRLGLPIFFNGTSDGLSGMPRPGAMHQVQITNGLDQITEANTLVKALILVPEVLEEGGHGLLLVREAAAGEIRCDLRLVVRRSADDGDIGTCKSVAMRFRETWPDATYTELRELVAHIFPRDGMLFIVVRYADGLSQRRNDGVTELTFARLDSIVAGSPDVDFASLSERFRGVCHCVRGETKDVSCQLVRCTEESVGLGHGHAFEHQCIAAVGHRNGRGGYAVVLEPGIHELEGLWTLCDEFSHLLLCQGLRKTAMETNGEDGEQLMAAVVITGGRRDGVCGTNRSAGRGKSDWCEVKKAAWKFLKSKVTKLLEQWESFMMQFCATQNPKSAGRGKSDWGEVKKAA